MEQVESPRPTRFTRKRIGIAAGAVVAVFVVAIAVSVLIFLRRDVPDLFENIAEHDELLRALKHLRHKKHEVLVFHILEGDTERRFKFPDVPMLFRDMETGEQMSIHPGQIREQYQEAVTAFTNRFRRSCLEFNIDFEELDTNQSYEKALLGYLNKRSRLS